MTMRECRDEPDRRCIVTGESQPVAGLIRFVLGPDDQIVVDIDQVLPGRGIWVAADSDAVQMAVQKSLFAKAARKKVKVELDLAGRIEALLTRRCLELLSLARRAGQAVAGFDKVRDQIKSAKTSLIFEAGDGALGGREKIRALAPGVPVVDLFLAEELAQPFGRDHVVHVAVAQGGLAERLRREVRRLGGFRKPAETVI